MSCNCKLFGNRILGLPEQLHPRFLSGLRKAELNSILSSAKHRQFRASSVILRQGEPAEQLFLLTSGQGRHFAVTNDGRKILLYWLTAGQIFGGAAVLSTPYQHLAGTELLTESCAWVWERRTIRELLSRYPGLLDNLLSIAVIEHIEWSVAAQVSLSADDARGRVAHLLASLASGIGKVTTDGIEIRIKNEDLASGANVTQFTVSRSLNEWQRAGILSKGRGKILLRKPFLLVPD